MAFLHHVAAFALVAGIAVAAFYLGNAACWRKNPDPSAVPAVRRILHLELVGVVLILLFAALIVRG